MKGDKVDVQAMSEFFERTYASEPEQLEKAAEAVGKCATLGEYRELGETRAYLACQTTGSVSGIDSFHYTVEQSQRVFKPLWKALRCPYMKSIK